jgi:hypothetical protein
MLLIPEEQWAKPGNLPKRQSSFGNPGALDRKELQRFELALFFVIVGSFQTNIFFPAVVIEWWSVSVMISLFAMFVTMIYGLDISKSCRQAELCQHAAPSVTFTNICLTNRGTALSI